MKKINIEQELVLKAYCILQGYRNGVLHYTDEEIEKTIDKLYETYKNSMEIK